MWGPVSARCPVCGAPAAPDYLYCHRCGTALIAAAPFPPPEPRRAVDRTRPGLLWTFVALVLLWVPGLSTVGALCLSVGSTLMYVDRHRFPRAHRDAASVAYGALWVAAGLYAILFIGFFGAAYAAWEDFQVLNALDDDASWLVLLTTVPTLIVALALALPVRFLLPPRLRPQVKWAGLALCALVGVATYLSYADVAAGLGSEPIRVASVLGVLNRISFARIVEGPAFAWLAYLYWRTRENVVPVARPRPQEAGVPE